MEALSNNQTTPMQCRSRCGFYGTPATEGMCSKCYKDYLKKRETSSSSGTSGTSPRNPIPSTPACVNTATPTALVITPCTALSSSVEERSRADSNLKSEATPPENPVGATASADATDVTSLDSCRGENGACAASNEILEAQPISEKSPVKKKRNCCAVCKKKVGLTGFGCRCGGLFCALHRYSDKHDCSFDYRTHGAEEIRKNNPVVKGEKIKQI